MKSRQLKKNSQMFSYKKSILRINTDLMDFIACSNLQNRHQCKETWSEDTPDGRWRRFTCEEITSQVKTSRDIFWIMESINGC